MPRMLRLLTVAAVLALSFEAPAQQPMTPAPMPAGSPAATNLADDTSVTRGTTADPAAPAGKEQPILAYFLALAGVGGTLLIVCAPARKK